jgi:hypothetical protein
MPRSGKACRRCAVDLEVGIEVADYVVDRERSAGRANHVEGVFAIVVAPQTPRIVRFSKRQYGA